MTTADEVPLLTPADAEKIKGSCPHCYDALQAIADGRAKVIDAKLATYDPAVERVVAKDAEPVACFSASEFEILQSGRTAMASPVIGNLKTDIPVYLAPPDHAALLVDLGIAIQMLAEWCVAVDEGGAGWDYWDEHYKSAMYREVPLRKKLDAAIAIARSKA